MLEKSARKSFYCFVGKSSLRLCCLQVHQYIEYILRLYWQHGMALPLFAITALVAALPCLRGTAAK
jgi:hypothetical protein